MPQTATPALSVILPTCDDFSTIRLTVRALSRQTVRDRIELVIVAPTDDVRIIDDEVSGFAAVKLVNGGPIRTSNISRAAGVRVASAPIVVFSEDHSFPDPDWAEALVAAHETGCVAAGPVLTNGNPGSMLSWANLLLEYAPWLDGASKAETTDLPGHNSSYNRDLLLSYGDDLESMIEVEAVVQRDLIKRGHRMILEPAARTSHLNFSTLSSAIPLRFNAGRSFAGHRARGFGPLMRGGYILGGPLIPFVRLVRIVSMIRRSERYSWLFPRIIPMLCIVLLADGLGELVGYLTGPGHAPVYLGTVEFNRVRFMNASDKAAYHQMIGTLA